MDFSRLCLTGTTATSVQLQTHKPDCLSTDPPWGVTAARREGFHAWPSPHSFVSPFTPALILLTYLVILEQATYNTYISPSSTLIIPSAGLFGGDIWLWLMQKFRDKGLIPLCRILYRLQNSGKCIVSFLIQISRDLSYDFTCGDKL